MHLQNVVPSFRVEHRPKTLDQSVPFNILYTFQPSFFRPDNGVVCLFWQRPFTQLGRVSISSAKYTKSWLFITSTKVWVLIKSLQWYGCGLVSWDPQQLRADFINATWLFYQNSLLIRLHHNRRDNTFRHLKIVGRYARRWTVIIRTETDTNKLP